MPEIHKNVAGTLSNQQTTIQLCSANTVLCGCDETLRIHVLLLCLFLWLLNPLAFVFVAK